MSSNFYANPLDWSNQFLAKGSSKTPTLWERSKNSKQKFPSHDSSVTAVKLDPQSLQLASGDCMSYLRIIDIATKALLLEESTVDGDAILSMDWRTPQELTIGTLDHVYHVDVRSGKMYSTDIPSAQKICAITWKEDGTMFAIGSNDDQVRVIDLRRLDQQNLLHVHAHKAAVKALRWIPNCKEPLLLSGGATGCRTFKVVNVNDHSVACEEITQAQICSIAFIGNHYFVAGFGFGAETDNLQLWRYLPDVPKLEKICAKTMLGRVLNVAWEPKNSFVAAGSSRGDLKIWQLEPNEKPKSPKPSPSIFDKFVVR
jgi:WD40 repeat protein